MTDSEKISIIRTALTTVCGKDPGNITPDMLISDFRIDSIGAVELQMEIEDLAKVRIPDDVELVTVEDMMNLIP